LPTGGGKSLLFTLPAYLEKALVTVVVVPLVALLADLRRRLEQSAIPCQEWRSETASIGAVVKIVLVAAEHATTHEFTAMCTRLANLNRLSRIVIDEAHLIVTSASYREAMHDFFSLARCTKSTICPSLSHLPPSMESEVKDKFMLYRSVTVRSSTVRTNLIYKIQIMDSKNDQFLDDAADVIQQYLATPSSSKDRAIVFCRSKQDTHAISSLLSQNETDFYHGALSADEKKEKLLQWKSGRIKVMVATSGFGAVIDYACVRLVVHVSLSYSLLDYIQETGRAGRDGERARCVTLVNQSTMKNWLAGVDFRTEGMKGTYELASLINEPGCLRQKLHAYVDGDEHVSNCWAMKQNYAMLAKRN